MVLSETKAFEKLSDFQFFCWQFYQKVVGYFRNEAGPICSAINEWAKKKMLKEISDYGFVGSKQDEFFFNICAIHNVFVMLYEHRRIKAKGK